MINLGGNLLYSLRVHFYKLYKHQEWLAMMKRTDR